MDLTEAMNNGAHGHIHELLGGVWSADWLGFQEKTSERIFPLVHKIVVRLNDWPKIVTVNVYAAAAYGTRYRSMNSELYRTHSSSNE